MLPKDMRGMSSVRRICDQHVKQIEHDYDAHTHDCYVALEVLCKVLESRKPVIVYFPESFWWLSRSSSWTIRQEFFNKWKELIKGLQATSNNEKIEMRKIFTNILRIKPPKDEDHLNTFRKQIEEDKPKVISRSNLSKMHMVLKEHGLLCTDLERVNTDGLVLNTRKAEKIIGWATNHYLFSCQLPSMVENRMNLPQASLNLLS